MTQLERDRYSQLKPIDRFTLSSTLIKVNVYPDAACRAEVAANHKECDRLFEESPKNGVLFLTRRFNKSALTLMEYKSLVSP